MNEKHVKKMIGKGNWEDFLQFMKGQTVGKNKDGSTDYYDHDVEVYCSQKFKSFQWD